MLRVVEMAVDDAARRGIELEVKAVDDDADERTAERVAKVLVDDPDVIAVVGHKNSGPSGAGAPVYAAAGLAQVTQCSTDNALSRSGWRTFFRLCADNERQAAVAADFAHARMPGARVVAVHDGTDYGRPLVHAFAQRLEALSKRAVPIFSMAVGQEDFTELAAKIHNADLIDLGGTEIESSKLMIALRAAGSKAQVLSSEGGPDNPITQLAGPAGEGSIHTYAGADPAATPASRAVLERCRREIGETPSYLVECYDAVSVIAEALRTGAASRAEVVDAIAVTDIEGLAGRIRFAGSGDRIDAPVSLWQVRNGRMVALEPASA